MATIIQKDASSDLLWISEEFKSHSGRPAWFDSRDLCCEYHHDLKNSSVADTIAADIMPQGEVGESFSCAV